MALTIEWRGAQALLDLLGRLGRGDEPAEAEWQAALAANSFFVNFYTGWTGVTRENLMETLRRCTQPGEPPANPVLAALAQGFRRASEQRPALQHKLARLQKVDPSALVELAWPYLPPDTPLESTIHLTLDWFNGAFHSAGEIGLSLLREISEPAVMGPMVAHELHHAGFRYWAERDPLRQALLAEGTGRAVAVRHVQNLLAEGLAIHYCSPLPAPPDEAIPEQNLPRWMAKLARFRREERALFAEAEGVLAQCLAADADLVACRRAYDGIAIDLEGIEPAGHYIGARMVETMAQVHPQAAIIACICSLGDFLPLYNKAAQQTGGYVYSAATVEPFSRIWG